MQSEEPPTKVARDDRRLFHVARSQETIESYGANTGFCASLAETTLIVAVVTDANTHPNVGLTTMTESPIAVKLDGMTGAFSYLIHELSATQWQRKSVITRCRHPFIEFAHGICLAPRLLGLYALPAFLPFR